MSTPSNSGRNDATTRRRFLKIATCGLGGCMGAVAAAPALGYLVDPVGRRIVSSSDEPIDAYPMARLAKDGAPVLIPLVARAQRDGWTTIEDVPLGSAWLRRVGDDVLALSSVCPHLGCSVGWNSAAGNFRCPCHDSEFARDGSYVRGPSQRGLDPLPVRVENGRVQVTWVRYRGGGAARERL